MAPSEGAVEGEARGWGSGPLPTMASLDMHPWERRLGMCIQQPCPSHAGAQCMSWFLGLPLQSAGPGCKGHTVRCDCTQGPYT